MTGEEQVEFEFLAVQLLVMRMRQQVEADRRPATIARCAAEVRAFFVENQSLDVVQKELEKLLRLDET